MTKREIERLIKAERAAERERAAKFLEWMADTVGKVGLVPGMLRLAARFLRNRAHLRPYPSAEAFQRSLRTRPDALPPVAGPMARKSRARKDPGEMN